MRLAGTRLKHHPSRAGLTRDSNAGPVWHYALYRDLLRLQEDGQWSAASLAIVRRYTHLLPAGHEAAIRAFRHEAVTAPAADSATA